MANYDVEILTVAQDGGDSYTIDITGKADQTEVDEIANVCVEESVTITPSDWSNTSPYTYTWTSSSVGTNSKIAIMLNDGAEAAGIDDFTYDKVTGGVQFTTTELPTGNLPLTIQIIEVVPNEAYDVDVPLTIAVSDWSDTSPYTYTWTDARVTAGCTVEVGYASGAEDCDVRLLDYTKGTGSITFVADVLPEQALPLIVHINNMDNTSIPVVTASDVSTDAVTGQTNVQGALTTLTNNIGELSNLTTTDQSSTVAAINELDSDIGSLNSKVDAQITVFVQLFNQNIAGKSTAAAETTFDLSSYIPSGYSLWSVEMQIQEGSSFYNLPWWNDGFTQSTRIQRLSNASVVIRNQATWSANTSITFTLHCKKT